MRPSSAVVQSLVIGAVLSIFPAYFNIICVLKIRVVRSAAQPMKEKHEPGGVCRERGLHELEIAFYRGN
jgi:hypothetical protein